MNFKPLILLGKHCNAQEVFDGSSNQFDFESVVSLGNPTHTDSSILRINTPSAIKNSQNRYKTKVILAPIAGVNTSKYVELRSVYESSRGTRGLHLDTILDHLSLPIVAKARNVDNRNHQFLPTADDLVDFVKDLPDTGIDSYILEPYFKHNEEYRVYASPFLEQHPMKYIFDRIVEKNGKPSLVTVDEATRRDGIILATRLLAEKSAKRINQRRASNPFRYENTEVPAELLTAAMRAIKAMGLDVGFVDFLYNSITESHKVTRVGTNPGNGLDKSGRNLVAEYLDKALRDIIMHKHLTRNRITQIPKYGGPNS